MMAFELHSIEERPYDPMRGIVEMKGTMTINGTYWESSKLMKSYEGTHRDRMLRMQAELEVIATGM